jgi:hypothetical protein
MLVAWAKETRKKQGNKNSGLLYKSDEEIYKK